MTEENVTEVSLDKPDARVEDESIIESDGEAELVIPEADAATEIEEEVPGDPTEGTVDRKTKRKLTAQERINQVIKGKRDLQEAKDTAERKAAMLQAQLEAYQTPAPVGFPPVAESFETDAEFHRAQGAFEASKRLEFERANTQYLKSIDDMAMKGDATVEEAQEMKNLFSKTASMGLPIDVDIQMEVAESKNPAHIVHYLMKNPGEMASISRMSKNKALRKIGELSVTLEISPNVKKKTLAPPPINPVGTSSSGTSGKTSKKLDDMTEAEIAKLSRADFKRLAGI